MIDFLGETDTKPTDATQPRIDFISTTFTKYERFEYL